jgi:hypothetical protein
MTNDVQHGLVLPEGAATATSRDERAAAWTQLANGLGARLDALLASEVWGRDLPERPAAPVTHGVYLFSEPGRHLYVGRTGRTERSVRAGKKSASGFRARLAGHCRPSSGLSSATFAIRLALEAAAQKGVVVAARRSKLLDDHQFAALFVAAKERITAMEFRTVDIEDDRECAVFEVYTAFVLATPYNSFATS